MGVHILLFFNARPSVLMIQKTNVANNWCFTFLHEINYEEFHGPLSSLQKGLLDVRNHGEVISIRFLNKPQIKSWISRWITMKRPPKTTTVGTLCESTHVTTSLSHRVTYDLPHVSIGFVCFVVFKASANRFLFPNILSLACWYSIVSVRMRFVRVTRARPPLD